MIITLFGISALLGSITCISISLFTYLKNRTSIVNRWYSISLICMALWCFDSFLVSTGLSEQAWYLHNIFYIGAIFSQVCFIQWVHAILGRTNKYRKAVSLIVLILAAFFSVLSITGHLTTKLDYNHIYSPFFRPTNIFNIFVVFVGFCATYGSVNLWNKIKKIDALLERQRLIYILLASLFMYVAGATYFLFVYDFRIWPVANIFVILSNLIVAYAILKYRLMDIRVVVRKTIFYSVATSIISVVYLVLVLIIQKIFLREIISQSYLMTSIALILAIAVFLKPFEYWLSRVLDKKFFKGTIFEISKQKERLETELERGERLRSVGILAAGMAHEIKNPLTVINTFAEYLPTKFDDPEFREKCSRIIKQEVGRVKDIVTNLLLFSKPSEPVQKKYDVHTILKDIIELLSNDLLNNRIKTKLQFANEGEGLFDPDQMKQAFLNIIMNAIDAMKQNGGELNIKTSLSSTGLSVEIGDTGCGISPEKIKHIFDPFYTDKEHGTGLGLAVTYSIVEKNYGKINVESEVGRGTKFIVTLPLI